MTQQTIVNGAGMTINLGTDDLSKKVVPITPEQIPQHLPMFFLFAQRGNGKFLVDGNTSQLIFGSSTFDPRSDYFNHATLFANESIAQANSIMVKRLIPTDAGPMSNVVVWLDVLVTMVDLYQRNPDGSITLDSMGDPTIVGSAPGLKAKFVKTYRTTVVEQETIGDKTEVVGDQTDAGTVGTVAVAQTAVGTTLVMNSGVGIIPTQAVTGTGIASNTTVSAVAGTATTTTAANGAASSAQAVITVDATTGLAVGMVVRDTTTSGAIPVGAKILSIGTGTITLNVNLTSGILDNDVIVAYPTVTLSAATTSALSSSASVSFGANATSTRYPLFELQNSYYGADGNNTGFRLWAPTTAGGNSMPTAMMAQYKVYPYMFSVIERADVNSNPTYDKTISGETQVMFTFAEGVINPTTDQQIGWDQIILQSYNMIDNPGYPDVIGRISNMYVYEANITTVTNLMWEFESVYIDSNSDITSDSTSAGLMNFVTGVSSDNVPYQTYQFVDSSTSVRMSQYSNVFLSGGADGTMDSTMYETLVSAEMDKYADPTDEVQDIAYNVESIIYDSGFSLDTKFKLAEFISVRKDTVCILGTHTVGDDTLTESEEHSVAVSLRTRLQMYPESDYFGTPVMRGMIMGRSGLVRNSEYTQRVPATFEILSKFAKYMGAGNGNWKSGSSPEGSPGNNITRMKDINITWVSDTVRNLNWDTGLNWVLRFDRSRYFIPAYKTVYDDDTSVLNSIVVALAIAQLNKIANSVWRTLTGRTDLTPAQLCDRSNGLVNDRVKGIFDNRYVIIPAATISDLDNLRGFSWSMPIKIGADNMRTVMTTWVESYRQADLVPNNNAPTGG